MRGLLDLSSRQCNRCSSELRRWVFSSELPRSYQTGHNVYNVDFSKRIPNYSWSITYGDGSAASGNVFRDSVSIGGVATAYQAVEAAQVISNEFLQSPSDGIMGMAFSSLNMGLFAPTYLSVEKLSFWLWHLILLTAGPALPPLGLALGSPAQASEHFPDQYSASAELPDRRSHSEAQRGWQLRFRLR